MTTQYCTTVAIANLTMQILAIICRDNLKSISAFKSGHGLSAATKMTLDLTAVLDSTQGYQAADHGICTEAWLWRHHATI